MSLFDVILHRNAQKEAEEKKEEEVLEYLEEDDENV